MPFYNVKKIIIYSFILAGVSIYSACDRKDVASINGENIKSDADGVVSSSEKNTGEFVINGIRLRIPSKYISFGKNQLDGVKDAINLRFYIENIASGLDDNSLDSNNKNTAIEVLIKKCNTKPCGDIPKIKFMNRLKVFDKNDSGCVNGESKKWPELNLNSYILGRYGNSSFEREMFIRGDVCNPSYILFCRINKIDNSPNCESWFVYNRNVSITYSFSREYIRYHELIMKGIYKKLNLFTIETKK